jgi:leucyl/phenylalanyl-tRNA--protein transferase
MVILSNEISFPKAELAESSGLLAVGGDLSLARLKLAYTSGIFPWYSEGEPILWYSPDPRMVLFPDELKISKSMRQIIRSNRFRVTFNQAFEEVIRNCKNIDRNQQGQAGTWITNEMEQAYILLHKDGWAKSVEVWEGDELVGGLYGVEVGSVFCGESMFSKVSNTSKLALIALVQNNKAYQLIDCQVYNDHLASLGAEEIPREQFLQHLKA